MAKSKAYLFSGVTIDWKANTFADTKLQNIPSTERFYFQNGLTDHVKSNTLPEYNISNDYFVDKVTFKESFDPKEKGSIEWSACFNTNNPTVKSFCNTIPTNEGGTHESGFLNAISKGFKSYVNLIGEKNFLKLTKMMFKRSYRVPFRFLLNNPNLLVKQKIDYPTSKFKKR